MTEFVRAFNGGGPSTFENGIGTPEDNLARFMTLLDGSDRWSFLLYPVPEGVDPWDGKFQGNEYMQAGGRAGQMSLDVRREEPDGVTRQYFIGRPGGDYSGDPEEEIFIQGHAAAHVYPNEVFEAEEAGRLFYEYFRTGWISAPYVLRDLHIADDA